MLRIDPESGVAYTFAMIVLVLIMVAVVFVLFSPFINGMTKMFNKDLEDGHISEQTKSAYEWNLGFALGIPTIALAVFFAYGIIRAYDIAKGAGWL